MAKLSFAQAIKNLFSAHKKEDTEFFEAPADALIEGDIGVKNAMEHVDQLETECKEGMLCFKRYPALFNSVDDAKRYLSKFDSVLDMLCSISIEPANYIPFGILITFDDEDHEKRLRNAIETIKNECKNSFSCRNCKLRHSDGDVKLCYILETCPEEWELSDNNSDDRIFK